MRDRCAGSAASSPTPIRRSRRHRCNGYNRPPSVSPDRLSRPLRPMPYGLSKARTSHRDFRRIRAATPTERPARQSAPASKRSCRKRCRRYCPPPLCRTFPKLRTHTAPRIRYSPADADGTDSGRDRSKVASSSGDTPPPPMRFPPRRPCRQSDSAPNRCRNRLLLHTWSEFAYHVAA